MLLNELLVAHSGPVDISGMCPPYLEIGQSGGKTGTALHSLAWSSNATSLDLLQKLLARNWKGNIDVAAVGHLTALHCACFGSAPDDLSRIGVIKLLLDNKANVNATADGCYVGAPNFYKRLECKQTTLQLAYEKGASHIVDLLVSRCGAASIEGSDSFGHTAVDYAAGNGDAKLLAVFLDTNPNVDTRSHTGTSPLHYACSAPGDS